MKRATMLLALMLAVGAGGALAGSTAEVHATLETEAFFESDEADADDPAIWVHPKKSARSIVVGTLKNGGLAVFDLDGKTIQRIDYEDEDARQNNVDLLYDVRLGGKTRDLAVVTDRGLDHLRVFEIDSRGAAAGSPLSEVTETDPPVIFEGDDDISAYGIAAWKEKSAAYVAISQRHQTTIALVRLAAKGKRLIGFERVDSLVLPSTFALGPGVGGQWSPCTEEDGERPQVEGMVADPARGFLYAAQEDVGIWQIPVDGGQLGQPALFDRVREFGQPYTRTFDPEEEEFVCEIDESAPSFGSDYLAADAEGLTVYPLRGDKGYLLASSQGSSTFIVYDRVSLEPLGTFKLAESPTDAVDESDGAMVVGVPLGDTFARGLLVTHDGDDEPNEDATNFKFTRWQDVASPLGLEIDTKSGDPRR